MSTSSPIDSSLGTTSAALPSSPIDSGRRAALASVAWRTASIEVVGHDVEVSGLDAPPDPRGVALDAQRDAAVHRDRERLRPAHPAEPGGEGQGAEERIAETFAGDGGEGLIGALEDALAPDVDPRSRRHLAVHREPEGLEATELLPGRPLRHEIRVRDQHPRRPLVGPDDPDRLAGLDEQRLVVTERAKLAADRLEGVPRPGGAAGSAVDDQVVRVLGHVGIEVVHEHPQAPPPAAIPCTSAPSPEAPARAAGPRSRPHQQRPGAPRGSDRSSRARRHRRASARPVRSVKRPPASSMITGIGARS